VLDIAELLVGYSGSGLQNFVQVIDTGDGNTLVRVDIDGSGTTYGFQNAVVLTGVSGVSLTDMVTNGNLTCHGLGWRVPTPCVTACSARRFRF
jgi:hypothetical protein